VQADSVADAVQEALSGYFDNTTGLAEVTDDFPDSAVAGRAKTGQRGALKTGQCYDAYTSSVPFHASFF
jgi:hypothetical protein